MLSQTATQLLRIKHNAPYQVSKCVPTDELQFMLAAEQDDERRTSSSRPDKVDSRSAGLFISLQWHTSGKVHPLRKTKLLLRKGRKKAWAVLLP